VTLVAVLTGAVVFLADLLRRLTLPVEVGAASARSYRGASTRPGRLRLALPSDCDLAGRDVVLVDDILDTGRTLGGLTRLARRRGAASVRTCVLLRKARPDLPHRMAADLVGFDVPDVFVVGYGLDFDGKYRSLPDVCTLRPSVAPAREAAS